MMNVITFKLSLQIIIIPNLQGASIATCEYAQFEKVEFTSNFYFLTGFILILFSFLKSVTQYKNNSFDQKPLLSYNMGDLWV